MGYFGKFLLAFLAIASVAHAKPPQKIAGGSSCQLSEFPFIVSINVNGAHICGGSIISPRHIITAAHCVATLGAHEVRNTRIVSGTIYYASGDVHSVKNVLYHRNYRVGDSTSPNDLAIIELTAPIQFNQYQNKIDVASSQTPTGVQATAIGWGYPSAQYQVNSYYLKKVPLTIIEAGQCQPYLPYQLWVNQICGSGNQGSGVCMGDSGGPLVYGGQLIGVVSYGIPCAVGKPDVFTNVYLYRSWINEVLAQ